MHTQQLIFKICKMFYYQQYSKVEIADKLRISRFKVARLLDQAVKDGIVRIQIVSPAREDTFVLEERLEKELKLKAVIVVEGSDFDEELNLQQLGIGTAYFLAETIQNDDVLGISGGTTVSEVIKALPDKIGVGGVKIVQIAGGLGQLNTVDGMKILHMIGEKFNTEVSTFMVPVLVQTPELKQVILEDQGVRQTIDLFQSISVALIGIGSWYPEIRTNLHKAGRFPQEDIDMLKKNGVVGDFFNHMVDISGNIIDGTLSDRLMTIDIETIKKIKYVIAVAGGEHKSHAILGAVRSGLIHVLVTDSFTAAKMLEIIESEKKGGSINMNAAGGVEAEQK